MNARSESTAIEPPAPRKTDPAKIRVGDVLEDTKGVPWRITDSQVLAEATYPTRYLRLERPGGLEACWSVDFLLAACVDLPDGHPDSLRLFIPCETKENRE